MSRTAARLSLVCALVGLGASAGAAYIHYRLLFDPTYLSFCDINATISCTQVYLSRYSTVAGVPVAIFAGLWFVVAGLLAASALTARQTVRESVPGYLFVLSTLALSVVLYLGYTSFFVLNAVCLMCLTIDAAVIGLFIISGAATKVPMTSLPRRAASDLRVLAASPLAITVAILWFVVSATTLAFFPREATTASASSAGAAAASTAPAEQAPLPAPSESERAEFERWFIAQPREAVDVPAGGAKVLIVKFNDFQCPPCRQAHIAYIPIIKKLQAAHPGEIAYTLVDFPLWSECNVTIPNAGPHPASCAAAVAVRLAREKGKDEAMIDWVFANQPQLTPDLVKQGVKDIAGVTDFDARYASTLALVKADTVKGQKMGVHQTPTFFLDGVKIEGAIAPQYFEQAIEYELAHAKK